MRAPEAHASTSMVVCDWNIATGKDGTSGSHGDWVYQGIDLHGQYMDLPAGTPQQAETTGDKLNVSYDLLRYHLQWERWILETGEHQDYTGAGGCTHDPDALPYTIYWSDGTGASEWWHSAGAYQDAHANGFIAITNTGSYAPTSVTWKVGNHLMGSGVELKWKDWGDQSVVTANIGIPEGQIVDISPIAFNASINPYTNYAGSAQAEPVISVSSAEAAPDNDGADMPTDAGPGEYPLSSGHWTITGLITAGTTVHASLTCNYSGVQPSDFVETLTGGAGVSGVLKDGGYEFDITSGTTHSYTLSRKLTNIAHAPGHYQEPCTLSVTPT
jgi:hypothetical protein